MHSHYKSMFHMPALSKGYNMVLLNKDSFYFYHL